MRFKIEKSIGGHFDDHKEVFKVYKERYFLWFPYWKIESYDTPHESVHRVFHTEKDALQYINIVYGTVKLVEEKIYSRQ